MTLSKKPQLSKNDNEVFCYGGIDKWICLAIFFIMLFVISVYCLYFFDPVDCVDCWGLGLLVFMALFSMWGHVATMKYRVEIDNEKISSGSFRKKYIYFNDIKEITLSFVVRGKGLLIVTKEGKHALKIGAAIQEFMELVKIIKARVPRNQVIYREGDEFGNWIEQIIK